MTSKKVGKKNTRAKSNTKTKHPHILFALQRNEFDICFHSFLLHLHPTKAAMSSGKHLTVFQAAQLTTRPDQVLQPPVDGISSIAFSPDSSRLLVSSWDGVRPISLSHPFRLAYDHTHCRQYNFMMCQDILNHLKCASHQQPKAKH